MSVIIIDDVVQCSGTDFYVCDFKGHCVAVFGQDGSFKYRIGNEKITCFPNGIDISDAGDILIGDSHGNRFHVACFSRDGVLQSEFECPHVKVTIVLPSNNCTMCVHERDYKYLSIFAIAGFSMLWFENHERRLRCNSGQK